MIGGELFVECLKAQGVKDIFGIPGGHLDPVYESNSHNPNAFLPVPDSIGTGPFAGVSARTALGQMV